MSRRRQTSRLKIERLEERAVLAAIAVDLLPTSYSAVVIESYRSGGVAGGGVQGPVAGSQFNQPSIFLQQADNPRGMFADVLPPQVDVNNETVESYSGNGILAPIAGTFNFTTRTSLAHDNQEFFEPGDFYQGNSQASVMSSVVLHFNPEQNGEDYIGKPMLLWISGTAGSSSTTGILRVQNESGIDLTIANSPEIAFDNLYSIELGDSLGLSWSSNMSLGTNDPNDSAQIVDFAAIRVSLIVAPNVAPVVSLPDAPTWNEDTAPVLVAPTASITDTDSLDFSNGYVSIFGQELTSDFRLRSQGTAPGQISVNAQGIVSYEGSPVATVVTTPGSIGVELHVGCSRAAAEAILRNITYRSIVGEPVAGAKILSLEVSDGDGPASRSSLTLQVVSVNDAPRIDTAIEQTFSDINEDVTNPTGNTIASLLTDVTDPDAGALKGLAITQVTGASTGKWQYSLNGGTTWLEIGIVSSAAALLLPSNGAQTKLRYVPNANFNGLVQLAYRAWDQTQGTAGTKVNLSSASSIGSTTAYSAAMERATLTIVAVNDAPKINAAPVPSLTTINEDATNPTGDAIQSLLVGATDIDAGALRGLALTQALGTSTGKWQYTLNSGATWINVGVVSNSAALLIPSNGPQTKLRYLPNANFNGAVQMAYRAWDQTQGSVGGTANIGSSTLFGGTTPYSSALMKNTLTVSAVNDAPRLNIALTPTLTTILEDEANPAGYSVQSLLVGASDVDAMALRGLAVTQVTGASTGKWQYTLNGGTSWTDVGTVSGASALLIPMDATQARLRYLPSPNFNGSVQVAYRAWDQTQGTAGSKVDISTASLQGGSKAYSLEMARATLTVAAVNDAPRWLATAPIVLGSIANTVPNSPEYLISSAILGANSSDVDAGAQTGIALWGLPAPSTATVWYQLSGTTTWTQITSASTSSALLLPSSAKLRFRPILGVTGAVQIRFAVWDQTTGTAAGRTVLDTVVSTGGSTAFSSSFGTAVLNIN